RFEVTMDDTRLVRLGQAAYDMAQHFQAGRNLELTHPGHAVVEAFAVKQFHDQERPFVVHARVVDLADVGTVNGCSCASFSDESLPHNSGGDELRRQNLDGDTLANVDILRLVDGGHAAATDLLGNSELTLKDGADGNVGTLSVRHLFGSRPEAPKSDPRRCTAPRQARQIGPQGGCLNRN